MALPDKDTLAAIAVTRFGLGARPGELAAAKSDPRGWLKAQIRASGADQPPGNLPGSAERIVAYREFQQDRRMVQQVQAQMKQGDPPNPQPQQLAGLAQATGVQEEMLARAQLAAATPAPFRERWALFWANHFTVSAIKAQTAPVAGPFEREVIRPNAFGQFATMCAASSSHPGMLSYLDQAQSIGPNSQAGLRRGRGAGLNENLAREILELHTVGVDGGYTQADVTEFARAMTGWSIGAPPDGANNGKFIYRPQTHEPGPRTVMGKRYRDEGGRTALNIILDLCLHPATARHVARKLATHFVSDSPPPALVAKLETAFRNSGGKLDVVANTLIDADEAWAPAPAKFKTPYELVISAHRTMGVQPSRPQQIAQPLNTLGQPPFRAPSPKGWPEEAAAWAAPDAVIKRLTWCEDYAAQVANGPRAPIQVAEDCLGKRLSTDVRTAILNAESRPEALTILFMSPEFQRR